MKNFNLPNHPDEELNDPAPDLSKIKRVSPILKEIAENYPYTTSGWINIIINILGTSKL